MHNKYFSYKIIDLSFLLSIFYNRKLSYLMTTPKEHKSDKENSGKSNSKT